MRSRKFKCRVVIGILCILVFASWAILTIVLQTTVKLNKLEINKREIELTTRNVVKKILVNISQDVIDMKDEIAAVARKLFKAKKHVRGSKTSDQLKGAIDIMENILDALKIPKQELNQRKIHASKSVCPEIYKGTTYGYPYFYKGFEETNCTYAKPLSELITILILFKGESEKDKLNRLRRLINSIQTYNANISVAITSKLNEGAINIQTEFPNATFIDTYGRNDGSSWNGIVKNIRTPYALIARNIELITTDSRLARLIGAIERLQVGVAASATRTPNGHWTHGCYQSMYRNYTLKYLEGYDESVNECMFCDFNPGPFVTTTDTLLKFPFDDFLDENNGLFEDWFLRLGQKGIETISCPDSMFHTNTMAAESDDWGQLMKKWDLYKIVSPQHKTLYSKCDSGYPLTDSKGLSPCLLNKNAGVVKLIMKTCEENNIICELQEGTALGAVKFGKTLPWERDGDITFLTKNYTAFQKLEPLFTSEGYQFKDLGSTWCCVDNRTAGGKFAISNSWNIELYGQHIMDSELLIADGIKPTKALLDGMWVNVPRNPGLFVRNRYGHEIYQHALHWMTVGENDGWINYKTNTFMKCDTPGEHNCLDRYNADGSLPYMDPLP